MPEQKEKKAKTGDWYLGFILIFSIFAILKVGNAVDWSWWWVFSPLWIPLLNIIASMIIIFIREVDKKIKEKENQ